MRRIAALLVSLAICGSLCADVPPPPITELHAEPIEVPKLLLTADLSALYTLHVIPSDSEFDVWDEHLRETLAIWLPEMLQVSRDDADLVIEYTEYAAGEHKRRWQATLYRFDCPSPELGAPATRAINGRCPSKIYLRVNLGTISGTADDSDGAARAFAAELRTGMLR